ncbi:MAG: diguanylate cyclase, partial [Gammaproteobacteria bacterium]|nr:diguanylate cyclase [Gammaproteobacteria bacterium]
MNFDTGSSKARTVLEQNEKGPDFSKIADFSDVLIVDDNINNLKLLRSLLAEQGYRVRLATNGEMALSSVTSNIPDLILLDITMPDMDGYEVCERLKNNQSTQDVPIIFLSALKEQFDIVRGLAMGAVDFVTKPFKAEVLLARVNTHLTINKLQNTLKSNNENLEIIVEARTQEIQKANTSLKHEIKQHFQTQHKLSASEKLHRLTLANIDDTVILIANQKDEFTYISPSIEKIFGYKPDKIDKNIFSNLLNIALFNKSIPRVNNDLQFFETKISHKDGKQHTLIVSVKHAFIHEKVTIYTCRDISHLKLAQEQLAKSESRLSHALDASNEGLWDWNVEENKIYFNDTFFMMLGYDTDTWPHTVDTLFNLLHPDDVELYKKQFERCTKKKISEFKIKCRLKNKAGNYCWILSKGKVVKRDDKIKPIRIVGTHTDISSEKEHEETLTRLASYDVLTGLPNRNYFRDIVYGAISRGKRNTQNHAILFIDLDRFKNINDSLGHSVGDRLLQLVATRLTEVIRGNDTVARLGGDEFTIFLDNIADTLKAAEISTRIIDVLSTPLFLHGHEVVISPSIGVVIYPDHGTSHEELLKKADTAMYRAKDAGGNTFRFFTDKMNDDVQKRIQLEESLRQGLVNDEFILHYQPKFDASTHNIAGMEALVRWNKNGNGLVSPAEFIPTVEETGLILPLGDQIIRKAIQQTKQWTDSNLFKDKVAINISPQQFRQANFLENIKIVLDESGLSPEH